MSEGGHGRDCLREYEKAKTLEGILAVKLARFRAPHFVPPPISHLWVGY